MQYANLDAAIKQAIKESLLQEQGYLCAYTLVPVNSAKDCHIEHVQAQSNAPQLGLDYNNMAACLPANGGDLSSGYGAPIKAGQQILHNDNFVSPHKLNVERRFTYTSNGGIAGIDTDEAAKSTVQILNLNHSGLRDLRERVIVANGIGLRPKKSRSPIKLLSAAGARNFAQKVLEPDVDGKLVPFCTCLSQIALRYANQEDERSARLRGKPQTST